MEHIFTVHCIMDSSAKWTILNPVGSLSICCAEARKETHILFTESDSDSPCTSESTRCCISKTALNAQNCTRFRLRFWSKTQLPGTRNNNNHKYRPRIGPKKNCSSDMASKIKWFINRFHQNGRIEMLGCHGWSWNAMSCYIRWVNT